MVSDIELWYWFKKTASSYQTKFILKLSLFFRRANLPLNWNPDQRGLQFKTLFELKEISAVQNSMQTLYYTWFYFLLVIW